MAAADAWPHPASGGSSAFPRGPRHAPQQRVQEITEAAANYAYVLTEYPNTWRVVGNSLALAAGGAALVLAVGLGVAYVRVRTLLPGRDALAMAASYTVIRPSVAFVAGVIWA